MKKEINELKKRALIAKQRLKMGYWESVSSERDALRREQVNADTISKLQRARLNRETRISGGEAAAKREEEMYRKVSEILSSDEDVLNPIGRLIDKQEYMRLDEQGKQKYVLELSRQFRELSKRYYLEHAGSMA